MYGVLFLVFRFYTYVKRSKYLSILADFIKHENLKQIT
jgi:hypothetical protein